MVGDLRSVIVSDEANDGQTADSYNFVFHINLVVLSILAIVFLYRLPRAIALFGSQEWLSGYLLRHVPYRPARSASRSRRIAQAHRNPSQPPSPTSQQGHSHEVMSDDSHTLAYHQPNPRRVDAMGREIEMEYPTHIPSCPSFMRWTLPLLRHQFSMDYSVGQVMVLVMYSWIMMFATFFNSSFFVDYNRVGWLSTAQFPFVMAYGAKNSVLGILWGMGYERLNYLHRFAGRVTVLTANLHGFGFAYRWSLAGTFTAAIKEPQNAWGLLALIALDILWLFSLSFWRQKAHNIFLTTHLFCFSLIIPGLWFHKPRLVPYVLATLGLFGLDYLLRLVKTRIVTATIRPLPELDLTRIEVPNINAGWRAGQHVRVRILSTGMGWFGWAEVHPFTIASVGAAAASRAPTTTTTTGSSSRGAAGNRRRAASAEGAEGMVLMCKKNGTWTNRLFEMAKISGYVDGFLGREVKLWVEGPYGGPGDNNFASFSAAVVVVGGSGISFGLSVVKDLVEKDLRGRSSLKAIELIWATQDPASLTPLLPTLASLVNQSIFTPLRISVHYTRATPTLPSIPAIPGLTLTPGRPRVTRIIDYAVSKALAVGTRFDFDTQPTAGNHIKDEKGRVGVGRSHSRRTKESHHGHYPSSKEGRTLEPDAEMEEAIGGRREKEDVKNITGVIVAVCGPPELSKDVIDAAGKVDSEKRNRVGGIEVHEEIFTW